MNTEFAFMNTISSILEQVYEVNKDNIKIATEKFAQNMAGNHLIHTFGTGHSHMMGIEMFSRAGGLANINPLLDPDTLTMFGSRRSGEIEKLSGVADIIYDNNFISKDDIMIISSNSGRNAMPIEMALRCKKEGVYVIAITSLKQSMETTSRHSSGKKLYEIADLVLDNCAPAGDTCLEFGGYETGSTSSITSLFILDTIVSEAVKYMVEHGQKPYVFQSQNVDTSNNVEAYMKYMGRVKYL